MVTERVLDSSENTVVNGQPDYQKTVQCPSEGNCNIEWGISINRDTDIKLLPKKRSCLPDMVFGALGGAAGGAALGSTLHPNDVQVSAERVDVWFDATWKYAAFGSAGTAFVTGVICYATR